MPTGVTWARCAFVTVAAGWLAWATLGPPRGLTYAADNTVDIGVHLHTIRAVGPHGQGHREAIEASRQLQQLDSSHLTSILVGMDEANPLAVNWLMGIAGSLIQDARRQGEPLPWKQLRQLLDDTSHHPRARRLAYELIREHDPTAAERLVPGWLNDPSLELRRDAVAWKTKLAEQAEAENDKQLAVQLFQQAFTSARDLDQVDALAKKLSSLEHPPDIATHLGMIQSWHLIGPFDNSGKAGFDTAYPPESEIDLEKSYEGKGGQQVAWKHYATSDPYGAVDLNVAVGKHMGAIAYAYVELIVDEQQDVELRLASTNGNKIWLNGELLTSNHVYHANVFLDQYVGKGQLKKGRNQILLKIAQNEQADAWAQDWKFQIRACDKIGTAILSQDRPAAQVAKGK